MKLIIDSGFPPMDDPMLIAMDDLLRRKKRKYQYKEIRDKEGRSKSIYISFPRYGPIDYITYYVSKWLGNQDNDE